MNIRKYTAYSFLFVGATVPAFLNAQDPGADDVIVLDEIQADNSVPIEESILPTTRPFVSLYGTEKSVVDTPRNVTIISREQLDAISVRDPRDFSKLTSSAYTQSNFGAPSNPSLRGQTSDVLVNNMRRGLTTNGNGLPTNFNAVESVNILKGPPSVAVGASQYVGGYVDLITKKPNFGENSMSFNITADSEGLLVGQLDGNYVVSDEIAFRVSYTKEETEDYFYDNQKRKSDAIYAAMTYKPSDTYRLELNAEAFFASYSENWGWNRVTQDLIDNGTYITGVVGADQRETLHDPTIYGPFGPGAIPDGGTFQIARETRLLGEGDDSQGYLITAQAIQEWTPDSETTIVNNTLFQYRDRDTYSSYQYTEVMRDNWMIENRTEYRKNFDLFGLIHKINTGVSIRYSDVSAANDFYHEPSQYWDLSRPTSEIGVTDEFVFFDTPFTAFTSASVPIIGEDVRGNLTLGRPASPGGTYDFDPLTPGLQSFTFDNAKVTAAGVNVNPGNLDANGNPTARYDANGDVNDSKVGQYGVFFQDDIEINDMFDILFGVRLDYVDVETSDPMFDDIQAFIEQFGTPESIARINALSAEETTQSELLYNYNISGVFKPTEDTSIYLTYNVAESAPVGLGGGISVGQASDVETFVRESELWELGFKGSFLDSKLFLGVAVYDQIRTDPIQGGGSVTTSATGFEFEANYQPSRNFYMTLGYSYVEAEASGLDGAFVAEAVPYNGFFNNVNLATGNSPSPGVPEHLINGLVSYKFTQNLGVTAGIVVTSPMYLTYAGAPGAFGGAIGSAEIPWQYTLDLGLFYEMDNWSIRFNVLNSTDEENFGAVNPVYGNASVFVELPRRYELSIGYKY